MQLTIQVHSYCGKTPSDAIQRVFNTYPVIIGRSLDCDYVLEDVSKYVSSNHAVISLNGNKLHIEDTSINGVYINGAIEPLGQGNSSPLRDGDTIVMGDYSVGVSVENELLSLSTPPPGSFSSQSAGVNKARPESRFDKPDLKNDDNPRDSGKSTEDDDWDLSFLDEHEEIKQIGDADWADPTPKESPSSFPATPADRPNHAPTSSLPGINNPGGVPDGILSDSMPNQKPPDKSDTDEAIREADSVENRPEKGSVMLPGNSSNNVSAEDSGSLVNQYEASAITDDDLTPVSGHLAGNDDWDLNLPDEHEEIDQAAVDDWAGPIPEEKPSPIPSTSIESPGQPSTPGLPDTSNPSQTAEADPIDAALRSKQIDNLDDEETLFVGAPPESKEEPSTPSPPHTDGSNATEVDETGAANLQLAPVVKDNDQAPLSVQFSSNKERALSTPDDLDETIHIEDAGWAGPMPRERPSAIASSSTENSIPADTSNMPAPDKQYQTLDAFLVGAGLDPKQFVNLDDEQVLREAGSLVNQAVEGIMLLLKSRSDFKDSIHSEVTMLASKNNNPLKFSQNGQEALKRLLTSQSNESFLDSQHAIKQAVEDLQLHQLAMLDGMKAAATSMLDQFDPEKLAGRLEERNPVAATIPIKREAKLWDLFQEKYNSICEDALSDFSDLFGREFHLAYEKRIKEKGRAPDF